VAAAVSTPQLSVVIPTLNEAGCIRGLCVALQPLRRRGHEIILVDGGSDDHTIDLGRPLVDRLLSSTQGRALQMRAGAAAASGTVLWFLHADTSVPDNADMLILEVLQNGRSDWGRFDITLSVKHPVLRCVAHLMNLRSCITGIATGDQGIFVRRSLYEDVGGIPPLPLMEDIALSRALKKHSRPACVRQKLLTSARRWQQHGIIRTILTMWGLRLAYFIGVSPRHLAKYYTMSRA
jgi:rSAM/selenodomain-associated transferase 2